MALITLTNTEFKDERRVSHKATMNSKENQNIGKKMEGRGKMNLILIPPLLLHQHLSLKLVKVFDYAKGRYYSQYYQDILESVIFTMMPSGIDNNSNDTYTKPENH